VTELCGAKRLGYFGTGQFYVAMKLLAAAQSGFPVRLESIKSEMPLPRFVGMKNDAELLRYPNHSQNTESQGHQLGKSTMRIARPSLDRNSLKRIESLGDKQEPRSPLRSPPNSPSSSSYQDKPLSYSYRKQWNSTEQLTVPFSCLSVCEWDVLMNSDTVLISACLAPQALSVERSTEEGSADYHDDPWRITEEQQEYYSMQFKSLQPDLSSLISGHSKTNKHTGPALFRPYFCCLSVIATPHYRTAVKDLLSTVALSVERSAEEGSADYHDDPWRITEEQQEYYTMQFKSLQPDLSSLISGSVAKNFFTKSKLSIPELSHIWELSDVDCDGALTLPEFCAAFHLIVARKNGFALPEKLPQTLQSAFLQIDAVSPKTKRDGVFLGSYSELVPSSKQKEPAHSEQWEAINELPTTPAPLIVFEDESGTALQADHGAQRPLRAKRTHFTKHNKTGHLCGASSSVAKNFFTKSKLSIPELSHIWELSDVDCDGALTLPEFCAAFHLIVARKNGFALPEKLPQTLQSAFLQIDAVSPKTKRDGVFLGSYSELVPSSKQKEPAHSEETNTVESTHPPLSDKSTPKQEPRIDSCMSDPPQELEQQVKSRTRQRYSILYESGAVKQNVLQHVASRVMIEVVHVRQYFSSITALANWPSSFGQWMRFCKYPVSACASGCLAL
ncbi:UNVERIFIED_CONTAM: hypothetical protein FKN15_012909, partial [Acipenser sinensis]